MRNKAWLKAKGVLALTLAGLMLVSSAAPMAAEPTTVYAADRRAEIEKSLYNAEYYAKANEDVAVALNGDPTALYNHWLNYGKAEGRNASMVFNAKYYLEVNPDVAAAVGADNYVGAYEHFVTSGLLEGRESSPVFSVKYYLQANTDVANAFNNDYVMAAQHFNESAIAEGRSGSGNFDYTVYRACNTDVGELYGDYVQGYYIHYINHGRAEGRTGGLGTSGGGSTGGNAAIDETAPSWRIFDAKFYLEKYPELATTVGTDEKALYQYWLNTGIALGQTASPVIVPEEYLELNADVADVFGNDEAAALNHFLTAGIFEGRTGSYEFDYSIYASCNTDVGGVFEKDIVGYYFHYVKYGKAENRTAAVYIPPSRNEVVTTETIKDTEGRKYVLGFNAYGDMIEQKVYDANDTLLNTNRITNNKYNVRFNFTDSKGSVRGNRQTNWSSKEKKMSNINEINRTSVPFYYAELALDEDGKEYYRFDSVEPQKQKYYYFSNGLLRDYHENIINEDKTIYYDVDGNIKYYILRVKFDEDGNLLKSERYDGDDTLVSYTMYEYLDENGSEKISTFNPDGSLKSYDIIEYNEDNNILKEAFYDGDGTLLYYWAYEYNEDGMLTKEEYVDKEESYGYQYTYEYYENGEYKKTEYSDDYSKEITMYFENGMVQKEESYYDGILNEYYAYDEEGSEVEYGCWEPIYDEEIGEDVKVFRKYYYTENKEERYDSTMKLIETIEYKEEYNEDGDITKEAIYRNGELQSYTTYTYEDGKTTISEYDGDGTLQSYRIITDLKTSSYDGDGTLLSYSITEVDGLNKKTSSYTATGELKSYVVREHYENGKVKKITYYDGNDVVLRITTYNQNGAVSTVFYNADGSIRQGTVLEYFDNGMSKKVTEYWNSKKEYEKEYYSNGCPKREKTYSVYGNLYDDVEYYWNGIVKKSSRDIYNPGGEELSYYTEQLFNEDGIRISNKSYNPDGSER